MLEFPGLPKSIKKRAFFSMPRAAVFADTDTLRRYGGVAEEGDGGLSVLKYKGWSFDSVHTKMIDSSELDRLEADVCGQFEEKLHIPPMIFGNDVMSIKKDDCINAREPLKLNINARDALKCWADQHSASRKEESPPQIVQVPYAKTWIEKSLPSGVSSEAKPEGGESSDGLTINDAVLQRKWDWTFCSDYCCTLQDDQKISMYELGNTESGTVFNEALHPNVYKSSSTGVNYDMLREHQRTNAPILYFDELVLYQDDLEDCGEVVFDAKLRVMPNSWFILSRNFVRVDGVVVKIRENRFFHAFGTDRVYLEVTWKECGIGSGMKDLPFVDINPNVLRDVNKLSQMVPPTQTGFYSFMV